MSVPKLYASESVALGIAKKKAKAEGGRWVVVEAGDMFKVERAEPEYLPAVGAEPQQPVISVPMDEPTPEPVLIIVPPTPPPAVIEIEQPAPTPAPEPETQTVTVTVTAERVTPQYITHIVNGHEKWREKVRMVSWSYDKDTKMATFTVDRRQARKWGLAA